MNYATLPAAKNAGIGQAGQQEREPEVARAIRALDSENEQLASSLGIFSERLRGALSERPKAAQPETQTPPSMGYSCELAANIANQAECVRARRREIEELMARLEL